MITNFALTLKRNGETVLEAKATRPMVWDIINQYLNAHQPAKRTETTSVAPKLEDMGNAEVGMVWVGGYESIGCEISYSVEKLSA